VRVDTGVDEGSEVSMFYDPMIAKLITEHAGRSVAFQVLSPRAAELNRWMPVKRPPDLSRFLLSPMPGLLLRVTVAPGEPVKAGQEVAVVEAMKMENVLVAAQDATVAAVLCEPGDSLTVDQPIVEFE
jgi:propionyl-CoA carboxylase alpha chain